MSNQDRNPFGGLNPHGGYVPMSEDEQEVISRLVEADDLEVHIRGWAILHKPKILFGDKRISVQFTLDFNEPAKPNPPIPIFYIDMELRTRAGLILFTERYVTVWENKPMMAFQGAYYELAWDIAINRIDPAIVKMIKPGATGLTSRLTDRDTGEVTTEGNMKVGGDKQKLLHLIKDGEKVIKEHDKKRLAKEEKKATYRIPDE